MGNFVGHKRRYLLRLIVRPSSGTRLRDEEGRKGRWKVAEVIPDSQKLFMGVIKKQLDI